VTSLATNLQRLLLCLQFPLEEPSVCSSAVAFWVALSCCIISHCDLFVHCGPSTKKKGKSVVHPECNNVLRSKHHLLRFCMKITAHTPYEAHKQPANRFGYTVRVRSCQLLTYNVVQIKKIRKETGHELGKVRRQANFWKVRRQANYWKVRRQVNYWKVRRQVNYWKVRRQANYWKVGVRLITERYGVRLITARYGVRLITEIPKYLFANWLL
jgi:hypothetical protein